MGKHVGVSHPLTDQSLRNPIPALEMVWKLRSSLVNPGIAALATSTSLQDHTIADAATCTLSRLPRYSFLIVLPLAVYYAWVRFIASFSPYHPNESQITTVLG